MVRGTGATSRSHNGYLFNGSNESEGGVPTIFSLRVTSDTLFSSKKKRKLSSSPPITQEFCWNIFHRGNEPPPRSWLMRSNHHPDRKRVQLAADVVALLMKLQPNVLPCKHTMQVITSQFFTLFLSQSNQDTGHAKFGRLG